MSNINKRKHVRTKLRADVKMCHSELGELDLHTGDVSDGGAYILSEGKTVPSIGAVVDVQVQGIGGDNAPVVKMRVVRIDNKGMGLEFIEQD